MGRIIERVVAACAPTPVTAKIRLGCTRDSINAIDVAQVVEEAGAAALTVHGRTAQDFFQGTADWERISAIKPHLQRIPLIGNGDLDSPAAVVEAFRRYAVDGVMIARAALGKPWLFRQAQAALRGEPIPPDPTLERRTALLLHHYRPGLPSGSATRRERADAQVRLLLCPRPPRRPRVPHPAWRQFHAGGVSRSGRALFSARIAGGIVIRGCKIFCPASNDGPCAFLVPLRCFSKAIRSARPSEHGDQDHRAPLASLLMPRSRVAKKLFIAHIRSPGSVLAILVRRMYLKHASVCSPEYELSPR